MTTIEERTTRILSNLAIVGVEADPDMVRDLVSGAREGDSDAEIARQAIEVTIEQSCGPAGGWLE